MKIKYLSLNKNVYLVSGAKNLALYDLNQHALYSISQKTAKLINRLLSQVNLFSTLAEEEKQITDELIKNHLLISSSVPGKLNDIQELKVSYPCEFAWIEVTRQCNLSCSFCYEKSSPHCHERMSFDDFLLVIDNLKKINVKRIQFIGGEPMLLGDDLKKMIRHCRKDFDFIEVYTNAVLIDAAWCKFFKEQNVNMALSIHSYLPAQHDKIVHCRGAHQKALKGINLLKQNNIPFRVATIKQKNCKMGIPTADFPCQLTPKEPKITGRASLSQLDFEMFKNKVITKEFFQTSLSCRKVQFAVTGYRCFLKNIYISTDLTVYPCVMERRGNYGNLKEKKLADMMTHKLRLLSKDQIDDCKICEYRYACFDCRPDSNGRSLYQKPWYCAYHPKTGKWMSPKVLFNRLFK